MKYSGLRAQKSDRAEALHKAPRRPTTRAAGEPELFQLYEEEPGGARLAAPLVEVAGPQERVLRHTMEHIVDVPPFVQILDLLVPQMGNQPVEFMNLFDTQTHVEQVIAAPKIPHDSILQRFVDRRRLHKAEQLMEVPTVMSFPLCKQSFAEQIIDIPVPRTRGDHGGLQGVPPGQGSQRTVEQIVDILAGGGLQGLLLDPRLAASSAVSPSHFSPFEKSAQSARSSSARVHGHSSSSTLSSHQMGRPSTPIAFEVEHFEYDGCWWGRR